MKKNHKGEYPIHSKIEMRRDIAKIVTHLHQGERSQSDLLLADLKARAVYFPEKIQQDVLMFSDQVQFQYDYDPWHRVTPEVQKAADQILLDLGLSPPKP